MAHRNAAIKGGLVSSEYETHTLQLSNYFPPAQHVQVGIWGIYHRMPVLGSQKKQAGKVNIQQQWSPSHSREKADRVRLAEECKKHKSTKHVADSLKHDLVNAGRREERRIKAEVELKDEAVALRGKLEESKAKERELHALLENIESKARAQAETLSKRMRRMELEYREKIRHVEVEADRALVNLRNSGQQQHIDNVQALCELRRQVENLDQAHKRALTLRDRVREEIHKKSILARMKKHGAYRPELRALVRTLLSYSCREGRVGRLVLEVARTFGVKIKHKMSARTVSRVAKEGKVMAEMQLAYEMQLTEDITISGDSTSRCHVNYQSMFAAMRTPEKGTDGSIRLSRLPHNRFLGILSTVDHLSSESLQTWLKRLMQLKVTFRDSPLAKRTAVTMQMARRQPMMQDLKRSKTMKGLGEHAKTRMEEAEAETLLFEWNTKKISNVGGVKAWDALEPEERAARNLATLDSMIESLGREAFEALSEADRRALELYVWSGCCMHKDQNSFKGGNDAMQLAWKKLGLKAKQPVPLVNKHTAKHIREILTPGKSFDCLADSDLKELKNLTCGGAKLAALCGAIFNNADNKKGQGDSYYQFFMLMLKKLGLTEENVKRFPDTNQTRFGSHGEAAGKLLTGAFTNIESNIVAGLKDAATLTKLAVLALYQQIITHPYSRLVCRPESEAINGLDLGPLHTKI
ncbi:hypothetical protein CYLTODRAFT_460087 [Cylindrobasidium torrendii FP15055 ss-10]|uniref:Uncharacterized protein n=1 Tax=Cylindrobasidium torrendii FP15055 ss-10 TaxID=1314674 RepID=A0A0D7AS34_9AGAR|nr:hypothetical protein CYLTODRAFT_460087 [Cylindrobasidium torrendii FP15055 ss-10]